MNPNQQIIEEFYAGFASHHAETMASCYHAEVTFEDPAFGKLHGKDVSDMWKMLIERSKDDLQIEFSDVQANKNLGSANWEATYHFSVNGRKVINKVNATFEFKDGLIYKHIDHFDFWHWAIQAFGTTGLLLGWSGFLKTKVRRQALQTLRQWQSKQR